MWMVGERRAELVTGFVLSGLGVYWILDARAMPPGEFSVPGPGFVPTVVGAGLCVVTMALAVRAATRRGGDGEVSLGHPHIWAALVAVLGTSLLFERLGFLVTIVLFVATMLRVLSALRWPSLILAAVAAGLAAHLFFAELLGIQLPAMPWR